MPSEYYKQKAFLKIMAVEQLEELLRQDAEVENSQFSGEDILEIMEVIERKRNDTVTSQSKIEKAWHDFKENYLGNTTLYIPAMDEGAEYRSQRIFPGQAQEEIISFPACSFDHHDADGGSLHYSF